MSRRYEMVDERDVFRDSVYQPDHSMIFDGENDGVYSVRSLEPIVPGPIGLKTIFYDPRFTPTERTLCITILVLVCTFCLATLIALFIGLGRVLSEISSLEEAAKHGVYMVPDLSEKGIFVYSNVRNSEKLRNSYVKQIDQYLKDYETKQNELAEYSKVCLPGEIVDNKFCKFDFHTQFGSQCSKENNYGYESGKPCFLFTFRDVFKWKPEIRLSESDNSNYLPFRCYARFNLSNSVYSNISYFPSLTTGQGGGFALNKIPTRLIVDSDGRSFFELPPLMMVQVVDPAIHRPFSINCQLKKTSIVNLDKLHGTTGVSFDFVPDYDLNG